jgi:hypothetical protein
MYPEQRLIHLLVHNARYHHARQVQAWLAWPGGGIKLHFFPASCPHLDAIEILSSLREEVPRNWHIYCDEITDNFTPLAQHSRISA